MNKNEKDFINLISSFLNSSTPEVRDYNWKEIFNYAYINHIVGVISSQMLSLPSDAVDKNARVHYKKYLAKSVVDYEERKKAKEYIISFMSDNNFDFMFVKGVAIRDYYPIPELRTSGDIDVIVRENQFEKIYDVLNGLKCSSLVYLPFVIEVEINGITVEIHKGADVFGNYFDDCIFDVADNEGNYYTLDMYYQLLYVLLHLVRHLQATGAGIRMLMDIDVCIRAIDNFDMQKFLAMCNDAGVGYCAEVILSLCKLWFNTPVNTSINLENNQEMVDVFASGFLNGGTFGFKNNNYSGVYLSMSSASGNFGVKEKMKAFLHWLFPPVDIIKEMFFYANKYPFLIPFAYFHRFVNGALRNKKNTATTIKGIANPNSASISISKILSELKLDE